MNPKLRLFLTVSIMTLVMMSCAPFRDSPFSDTLMRADRDLNTENMQKITSAEDDGVIRVAMLADSHGNYKDLNTAISEINGTADVDFVVHLGDFTNSSYNFEYDQFLAQWAGINRPKLMVQGNHDALGAGPGLFRKAFGPSNYFFETEHVRFVFWNSVGMENPDDFDADWLEERVNESTKPVLIFSHIPLNDEERFHDEVAEDLLAVRANPKVFAVMNGHNHVYLLREDQGTMLLQSPRVEGGEWLLFEIKVDGFHIKQSRVAGATWVGFKTTSF